MPSTNSEAEVVTSWNYFKRDVDALLRLGADTESFSSVIANRQSTHFHSNAQLLTGYAVSFNRRHHRYGHLFLSEA
jgi:hypothetical protein